MQNLMIHKLSLAPLSVFGNLWFSSWSNMDIQANRMGSEEVYIVRTSLPGFGTKDSPENTCQNPKL